MNNVKRKKILNHGGQEGTGEEKRKEQTANHANRATVGAVRELPKKRMPSTSVMVAAVAEAEEDRASEGRI
jgi:hypothetical protein